MELWLRTRGTVGSNPIEGANILSGAHMASDWTEELKQEVITAYIAEEPTPENTTEIISELADKFKKTVNGIRMILIKAEKYVAIKAKTSTSSSDSGDKPKRKTKQESLDELSELLTKHGVTADATIIDKLTGKAADYFTAAFTTVIEN